MKAVKLMADYRARLASAGRMLEARAVERCIVLTKAGKKEDKPKDNKQ